MTLLWVRDALNDPALSQAGVEWLPASGQAFLEWPLALWVPGTHQVTLLWVKEASGDVALGQGRQAVSGAALGQGRLR